MSIKLFVASAALVLSAFTTQAQAAATWTVTAAGHIDTGSDGLGYFGAKGRNLAGISFIETITANVDPALWSWSYSDSHSAAVGGVGPGFTTTITINGITRTFNTISATDGRQTVANIPDTNVIELWQIGHLADSALIYPIIRLYGNTGSLPLANFDQSFSGTALNSTFLGQVGISLLTAQGLTEFATTRVDSLTVNTAPVPEPETYAMLLAGLGLVGAIPRRKHQAA